MSFGTFGPDSMEKSFKNLAATFSIFSEEYDLSLDQNLGSLDLSIKQGFIDKSKLKEELNMAQSDPNFNWVEFAIDNKLIVRNKQTYTNDHVKNYFKSLVWKYLYPDEA